MPDPSHEELLAHAAAVAEPVASMAAYRLTQLDQTVVERLASWTPQLKQRGVSTKQWAQWEATVRVAVVCARPSNETVAGAMLGTALGLVQFAVTQRRTPLRADFIFRATTTDVYLKSLPVGTQHVVGSHLRFLVAGIASALSEPVPDPAAAAPAENAADGETTVEPLLLNGEAPTLQELTRLGMASQPAREFFTVLADVRARVLEVEPRALRREERFAGRGRSIPYGDVEVVALLAAASAQRTNKGRTYATAAICLGLGAGVSGEDAASLKGADIVAHDPSIGGPAVRTRHGLVALHTAFAAPVLAAAQAAGPTGWVLGGGQARVNRVARICSALSTSNPHLVRVNSARLAATWFAVHLTRGVPVGQLLAAQGYVSSAALDSILQYLPQQTARGNALLGGRDADFHAAERGSAS